MTTGVRNNQVTETAWTFDCAGHPSVAILHRPHQPAALGMLIVVGGPQYRVGGHRQFVELARGLAARGIPVMRFDYRGIGDCPGEHPGFTNIAPDIEAAIDAFHSAIPEVRKLVLWSMCNGVTAASEVAARTSWIVGLVAVNPWVRDAGSHDRTLLRHYYLRRPFQPDFWHNLLQGRSHTRDFFSLVRRSMVSLLGAVQSSELAPGRARNPLAHRTIDALARFQGETLLILSGNDLTAREFADEAEKVASWRRLLSSSRLQRADLPTADHTFSDPAARQDVAEITQTWICGLADLAEQPAARRPGPSPVAASPAPKRALGS